MGAFVSKLPKDLTPDSPEELYDKAYWASGYKMSRAWVINKFWTTPDAVRYYELTSKKTPHILLPKDEYESATKAVELIRASPYAAMYFTRRSPQYELLHQVPIYFTLDGHECKALLDGILIDHAEETIEPFDLKTIGKSVYDFPENYLNFGYYTQAAFYTYAVATPESPVMELLEKGYTLKDFIFIVAETKTSSTNPALIYTTTLNERLCGMWGGYVGNRYYKGIRQLLEDYKWHVESNEWTYPKKIFQDQGRVELNLFRDDRHDIRT